MFGSFVKLLEFEGERIVLSLIICYYSTMNLMDILKNPSDDHGYVPFVVITISYFSHSELLTGFVARVARRVAVVEQEPQTETIKISTFIFHSIFYLRILDEGYSRNAPCALE